MENWDQQLLPIAMLILGAVLSFCGAIYWFRRTVRDTEAQHRDARYLQMMHRVDAMEQKLGLVSQSALPISTAFQAILVRQLTHFHTPRMDELMAKLGPPSILTTEEEYELLTALEERERDMGDLISQEERDAAHILPIVMHRAKHEIAMLGVLPSSFQLVIVPMGEGENLPAPERARA